MVNSSSEKGLLVTVRKKCQSENCVCGGLVQIVQVRPLTQEEADDYALSVMQSDSYMVKQRKMPCLYWIPLSQIIPVMESKTNSTPLTAESFLHKYIQHDGPEDDEFEEYQEDDDDD